MIERATVTAPKMISLLGWWTLVLAAPVIFLRRWRRRRRTEPGPRRRVRRSPGASGRREGSVTPPARASLSLPPIEPDPLAPATQDREAAADESSVGGPAASVVATPETKRPCFSVLSTPRLSPEALEPLCRYVDFQRRPELAASELRAAPGFRCVVCGDRAPTHGSDS
jgi:hypothetical protein